MIATELDWAWLAGFVDGEGCFCMLANRYRAGQMSYVPRLAIGNTNFAALRRCHEITGLGFISSWGGNQGQRNRTHKSTKGWVVASNNAITVIRRLLGYLVIKREAALLCHYSIAFRIYSAPRAYSKPQWANERLRKMRALHDFVSALNHRGTGSDNRLLRVERTHGFDLGSLIAEAEAAFNTAQMSEPENCPTDEYPAEIESWLTGAVTP